MTALRTKTAALVGGALAAGLIVGGGVIVWGSEAGSEPVAQGSDGGATRDVKAILAAKQEPSSPPKPGEDVKIGPWQAGKPAPDLTPVDLDNGVSGYLRVYDLAHGSLNPSFERKVNEHTTETVLPVYAADGQTVIGEFVAGTATVGERP